MESNEDYLSRALGQFGSKRTAKVVKLADKQPSELDEQLAFCRRLSKEFPDLMYESDLSSGAQKTPFWQNLILQLKSGDSFPDVTIYKQSKGYIGCKIEMKLKSPYLKDGSLSTQQHIQDQHKCHEKLREQGWFVSFAAGREEAWRIFMEYCG